jgi:hypothetical protein
LAVGVPGRAFRFLCHSMNEFPFSWIRICNRLCEVAAAGEDIIAKYIDIGVKLIC